MILSSDHTQITFISFAYGPLRLEFAVQIFYHDRKDEVERIWMKRYKL